MISGCWLIALSTETMSPNAAHPLFMIEVIPILNDETTKSHVGFISAPMAKMQLMEMSRRQSFRRGWMQQEQRKVRGRRSDGEESASIAPRGGLFLRRHCKLQQQEASELKTLRGVASGIIHCNTDSLVVKTPIEATSRNSLPITFLKSDDPLCESGVPCILRGYIFRNVSSDELLSKEQDLRCSVIGGTFVRMLPSVSLFSGNQCIQSHLCTSLLSRTLYFEQHNNHFIQTSAQTTQSTDNSKQPNSYSKLASYDKESIRALTLRMSTMLLNTTWIGTTPSALRYWKEHLTISPTQQQLDDLFSLQQNCFDLHDKTPNPLNSNNPIPHLLKEGSILLYNSYPNSGKSTLVTTIAQELKCTVHVVSCALFAAYGVQADKALECTLYELVLGGAVCGMSEGDGVARVCIVLDHFESFMYGEGVDSYTAVLNSISSYLNRLSDSLKSKNEFPFPISNPMYNASNIGTLQTPGFALPLGLCIVGVMTCADDGKQHNGQLSRAFDALGGGRMYLPLPSTLTRVSAFRHAFQVLGVELDEEARQMLPELVASKTWAYGALFMEVAKKLYSLLGPSGSKRLATAFDVLKAMDYVENNQIKQSAKAKSSFSISSTTTNNPTSDLFKSVGGNTEAKLALEDALALNPKKRRLLSRFGLQPPTGVLLFGPPGTGKTLLARAISQAISQNGTSCGTFISLKASDVVRPEIGNSEKLIVSTFESARVNAPSVVFIDEFQALFGDRESSGVIVGQLATTLLQCMDDITRWSEAEPSQGNESMHNTRIVVLGATNTPWMIDKAFLRPGRFDRAVHVGLPDLQEREEILHVHSCKMKITSTENAESICKTMAGLCCGFSGADIAALCRAAAVRCLSEGDAVEGIREKHFRDAFMYDVVPSSNDELVRRISRWKM